MNSPVTSEFTAQKASNAENVSIWWRQHDPTVIVYIFTCVVIATIYLARFSQQQAYFTCRERPSALGEHIIRRPLAEISLCQKLFCKYSIVCGRPIINSYNIDHKNNNSLVISFMQNKCWFIFLMPISGLNRWGKTICVSDCRETKIQIHVYVST